MRASVVPLISPPAPPLPPEPELVPPPPPPPPDRVSVADTVPAGGVEVTYDVQFVPLLQVAAIPVVVAPAICGVAVMDRGDGDDAEHAGDHGRGQPAGGQPEEPSVVPPGEPVGADLRPPVARSSVGTTNPTRMCALLALPRLVRLGRTVRRPTPVRAQLPPVSSPDDLGKICRLRPDSNKYYVLWWHDYGPRCAFDRRPNGRRVAVSSDPKGSRAAGPDDTRVSPIRATDSAAAVVANGGAVIYGSFVPRPRRASGDLGGSSTVS